MTPAGIIPWSLDQVRDWPGGPVRWQLTMDVTSGEAQAIGVARGVTWLRTISSYSGSRQLVGIDVTVAEATLIANGAPPMAVLVPGWAPDAPRLYIRPLSLSELMNDRRL